MARIITTALSAVTIIALGIVALQYRVDDLNDAELTNSSAEAFNLTREVSGGATTIMSNAVPRLFVIVLLVFIIAMLLLTR